MATRILKLGSQNPVGILVLGESGRDPDGNQNPETWRNPVGILILGESGRYPDGNQNPITTRFRKPSGIPKAVESTTNPNEFQNPG